MWRLFAWFMSEKAKLKSKIKLLLVISTIASTGVLASTEPAMAQLKGAKSLLGSFYGNTIPDDEALMNLLAQGRVGDVQLGYTDEIRAFYEARKGEPVLRIEDLLRTRSRDARRDLRELSVRDGDVGVLHHGRIRPDDAHVPDQEIEFLLRSHGFLLA